MLTDGERQILKKVKRKLKPPSEKEFNTVIARWLFGRNAEKMMRYAPWSFILIKLMWKKGEEPWEN
jgi:hypothetical protein